MLLEVNLSIINRGFYYDMAFINLNLGNKQINSHFN